MATYDRTFGTASYQSASDSRLARKLHIDWSAVFGGTALGWGLLLLLSVIGGAIGFAAIDPYSARPGAGLDVGSGIWAIAAMLLTSFLGAFFVVRISGDRRRSESLLHGGISWGLSMIAGAALALSAANASAPAAAMAARRAPASRTERTVVTNGNGTTSTTRVAPRSAVEADRADDAARAMAKAGGVAAGASFLALIAALFGALFAASRASGISIKNEFRPNLKLGKSGLKQPPHPQVMSPGAADLHRDDTTILPPTH